MMRSDDRMNEEIVFNWRLWPWRRFGYEGGGCSIRIVGTLVSALKVSDGAVRKSTQLRIHHHYADCMLH